MRGTGSLQSGAQFGGMLNYITKRADTMKTISFETINSIGSYGLVSTYNAVGGRNVKIDYNAYVSKRISKLRSLRKVLFIGNIIYIHTNETEEVILSLF